MKKSLFTALAVSFFMIGFSASDLPASDEPNVDDPQDQPVTPDEPTPDDPSDEEVTQVWHWKATKMNGGAVWGNGGYMAGEQTGDGAITGAWWGCGTQDGDSADKFSSQQAQAGGLYDEFEGDTYNASKMVFNEKKGTITVFNENGDIVREGSYSFDMTPDPEIFSKGTLTTSEGAILWPFAINTDGMQPTSFEIGYLDDETMILIYAQPDTYAWSECTWWSFGKK